MPIAGGGPLAPDELEALLRRLAVEGRFEEIVRGPVLELEDPAIATGSDAPGLCLLVEVAGLSMLVGGGLKSRSLSQILGSSK